ncbi:phospholipase D family protein [Burkholderia multivorans]|nr:phospholipase D family protein [Burkholderia multivorans]
MATAPKYLQGSDLESTVRRLIESHEELYWAVAWGSMSPLAKHLLSHAAKVKRFAIGTHFHQTDPDLLEALRSVPGVRVVPNSSAGTFHPKIYLFRTAGKFALVLGSPNFTRAGFGINYEAALYVEGTTSDALYGDVFRAIEYAWNASRHISEDFLRAYRLKHRATQAARADLEQDLPIKMPKGDAGYRNLLDDDWSEFVERVKSDPYHDVEGRVAIMDQARVWFSQIPRFADMTEGQRKAIAGTYVRNERKPAEVPPLDWAWFGSMVGAGVFKGLVKSRPEGLSAALDFIPRTGSITEIDFERFKEKFLESFDDADRGGGLATASRLLALKRPDYFVCVDSANKDKLSEAIGVKKAQLTVDTYWTHVIRPLLCSPWWNGTRPADDLDGRIWDSRMAFIDAFCYER